MLLDEMLSKVMEGMARPLKARISTVLDEVRGIGVAYRLVNYLAFYSITIGELAGTGSPLGEALSDCRGVAYRVFEASVRKEVSRAVG
ncbi:unnamed protein product, partial [Discosporangium mesarthrocarpum]